MDIIFNNDNIIITNYTEELKQKLIKDLTVINKNTQYLIKKVNNNPYLQQYYNLKELKESAKQCLVKEINNTLILPPGFDYLFKNEKITDLRADTGKNITIPWVIKPPHSARDYQVDSLELLKNNYRGVINLATGLGKSFIMTLAIKHFKKKTLVICPSESIASQFYNDLCLYFGKNKIGFFGDGKKKIGDITVAIAASVNKNVELFKNEDLGLILVDETHHTPCNTFYSVIEALSGVGRIFGFTATAFRSDGLDLLINAACGGILIERDVIWGVKNGHLAKPYFIIRKIDTNGMKDYKEDKLKCYKSHVLNCDKMKKRILEDAKSFIAAGKKVLILVDMVEHGQELSEQLGIPFSCGKDKKSKEYLKDFNNGIINGLVGVDTKIGEGSDTKVVDVLILANFIVSKGAVLQCVGRGLRKTVDKNMCIILDYVPLGSKMLKRHALTRYKLYKTITDDVRVFD